MCLRFDLIVVVLLRTTTTNTPTCQIQPRRKLYRKLIKFQQRCCRCDEEVRMILRVRVFNVIFFFDRILFIPYGVHVSPNFFVCFSEPNHEQVVYMRSPSGRDCTVDTLGCISWHPLHGNYALSALHSNGWPYILAPASHLPRK